MIKQQTPTESWEMLSGRPDAKLIDVRSTIEHTHVGHPINAIHIPWKDGPDWNLNTGFVDQVISAIPVKTTPILLLCRSGQRSMAAAKALEAEGFSNLTNIVEGFEGALDENKHRGNLSGWRFHGLPWVQS